MRGVGVAVAVAAALAACAAPEGSVRTETGAVIGTGAAREIAARDSIIWVPPAARPRDTRRVTMLPDRYSETVDIAGGQIAVDRIASGGSFPSGAEPEVLRRLWQMDYLRQEGFATDLPAVQVTAMPYARLHHVSGEGTRLRCVLAAGMFWQGDYSGGPRAAGNMALRAVVCVPKTQARDDALALLRDLRFGDGVNR